MVFATLGRLHADSHRLWGISVCLRGQRSIELLRGRDRKGRLPPAARERRTGFTASAVAADGKLYFTSENGDIYVVQSGPSFKLLATNVMDEACMATPAISDGQLILRTVSHVYAIGPPQDQVVTSPDVALLKTELFGGTEPFVSARN